MIFVNTKRPIALNSEVMSLASIIFPAIILPIPTGDSLEKNKINLFISHS